MAEGQSGVTSGRLPPIGFWSYARIDGEAARGRLTRLRERLQTELQQQYGRDEVRIFQDLRAIAPGDDWERELRDAIRDATFLIPIITPNFLQSLWCCREVMMFAEQEERINERHPELRGRKRIFPILYIDIAKTDPVDPAVLPLLRTRQWLDFRSLRISDDDELSVQRTLSGLAEGINDLLNVRIVIPDTSEQERLDEQKARDEAAAKARGAREAKAREARAAKAKERAEAVRQQRANERDAELARKAAEAETAHRVLDPEPPIDQVEEDEPANPWFRKPLGLASITATILIVAVAIFFGRDTGPHEPIPEMNAVAAVDQPGDLPTAATSMVAEPPAASDPSNPATAVLAAIPNAGWTNDETLPHVYETVLGRATFSSVLALADAGSAKAQYVIGQSYALGVGDIPISQDKATSYFKMAAARGLPVAELAMADRFNSGVDGAVGQNVEIARRWFDVAASHGNRQASEYIAAMK